MPNAITSTGLTTASRAELVANFTAAMQSIYGADIDLSSDSPDGQMMNIFIQSVLDLEDLVTQVFNMMDPDNAIGAVLDQRVAINGIHRQAGTFTLTNVTIVTSKALNLYGLDQNVEPVYTVADNAGNNWQLVATQNISAAGTYVLAFQSAVAGAVLTVPNTITVPVSIILGVTSINNPTTYTTLGLDEESDALLKVRRQKSVSISSQGYLSGLLAALENINGVSSAFVYENVTGSTDSNGVGGHSIWVIVAGTASAADIATAIYSHRNAGCGMTGAQTYVITQVDGSPFVVSWDNVASQNLYVKCSISSIDGVNAPNIAAILAALPTLYSVNQEVNVNALATAIQAVDPNALVTGAGFCLAATGTYVNKLSPSSKKNQFSVAATYAPSLLPFTATVASGGATQAFTAAHGYGSNTFSMVSGAGSINPSTGVYTSATAGTDVVGVTDAIGNTATATVTVV